WLGRLTTSQSSTSTGIAVDVRSWISVISVGALADARSRASGGASPNVAIGSADVGSADVGSAGVGSLISIGPVPDTRASVRLASHAGDIQLAAPPSPSNTAADTTGAASVA